MNTQESNPALSGRIIPTFFYYVIPSIVGLVAITTANLVDGIFVGNHIGANALASITLQIPYFTFLIALSLMIAIGGSVRAGKYIGEDNIPAASAIFSKSLITALIINTFFAVASLIFEKPLYALLNAPADIQPLIDQYFSIIRWVLILQLTTMVLYYFVRADGHPILATVALVTGALINIILDAWFIIYWDMGLAGAAYATGIAQIIQFFVLLYYFFSAKKTLNFSLFQKKWLEIFHSAYNGLSEFVNEISVGLLFLLLNTLLITRLGIDGVAAFSIVNYFIFLSIMLCYGIADALHLLISQNYGAQKYNRIKDFLTIAIFSAFLLGVILICILLLWQEYAISWFLKPDSTHVAQLTGQLLLIMWPLFLVNGINIVLSSYLTALHQPKPSAIISLSRSLVLPACFLIFLYFLLQQQWANQLLTTDWSFLIALPLAEWVTFILAIVICYHCKPRPVDTH